MAQHRVYVGECAADTGWARYVSC